MPNKVKYIHMEPIRVQKYISEHGIASRRKAEEFIQSGQVSINGKRAKLGDKVDPEKDVVSVYGKVIRPTEEKIYIALNKPKEYVVSKSDPQHRRTIFKLLPKELQTKVWNVGRLDYHTEGLLILTNDGELTQQLAHPSFEHQKEYEVLVNLAPNDQQLQLLREGVDIATGTTYPAKVKNKGTTILITIHEGKKRQVRRMIEAVGLKVKNLKRIRINKLKLPDIPPGQFVHIQKSDIL